MKSLLLAFLILLLPLAAVACGDDDDGDTGGSDGSDATSTATRVATQTATTTRTATATATATRTATASPGGASGIDVTEDEFTIDLSDDTADAGEVTFSIENEGAIVHNFVIVDTDEAADSLLLDGAEVDLDALTVVDRTEDIPAGESADLTADLSPGRYVLICNVIGHYQAGMHVEFEVE
ncbi:MAG: sulfocyanin-like copper-binding protein [Dehalococcoidia bacterium]